MIDLQLNESHDLQFDGFDFALVKDSPAIAQRIKIRLLTIQGEYKWDFTIGIPWFDEIFNIQTSFTQKNGWLRNTIINTEGVDSLQVFNFGLDRANRTARLVFAATSTLDDAIEGALTQIAKKEN